MYIVTFFSCSGGVGCTTAVENVAWELARRGRQVLLVDFNLESPELTTGQSVRRAGLVDYVTAYREKGESPDVAQYIAPISTGGEKGHLWVMPAGQVDAAYWSTLADIDWRDLYKTQDGYLFFEDMREQWAEINLYEIQYGDLLFEDTRKQRDKLKLDYVLVDTHAGITPSLGITTRQLADTVVMLFNPRKRVGDELYKVSEWITEEARHSGRKPIELFEIPTWVVEADEEPCSWHGDSDSIFFRPTAIPFSHRLLGGRQVVARKDFSRLALAYRRLTNAIIAENFAHDRDGARVALCEIHADPKRAIGFYHPSEPWRKDFDKLEKIIEVYDGDPEILAQAACCLYAGQRYDRALQCLDQAIEVQRDAPELLWQRASYRSRRGMKKQAIEDLVSLLNICTSARRFTADGASLETLKLDVLQSHLKPKRPRFTLPEGFEERSAELIALPDYSNPLIQLSPFDPYLVSSLRLLNQLDSQRYDQVRNWQYFTSLSDEIRIKLFADVLQGGDRVDLRSLVADRKWNDVVAWSRQVESGLWMLEDAVCVYVAWSALDNQEELQTCSRLAKERFEQLLSYDQLLPLSDIAMVAVIFWKSGDSVTAKTLLDAIIDLDVCPEADPIFSYQRLAWVNWKQFKEDCRELRQMFKGARIPLAFLENVPARVTE